MVADSSDEEDKYSYTYFLRSRIPCYRLIRPQHQGPAVMLRNPQIQPKLCATAREFCSPVRQEAERTQDKKEVHNVPDFVEERSDQVEGMNDGEKRTRTEKGDYHIGSHMTLLVIHCNAC